ncbi:MAG: hypothetical protein RLZZ216_2550 [Cyanobacteriota bacterium]|jgi:hypothetical protein
MGRDWKARLLHLVCVVVLLLTLPLAAAAAEVLQVRSPSLLQIGDRNRNYTVRLACLEVDAAQEAEAIDWLRQALPRRRLVNLRPVGTEDGTLLARVTPLGAEQDLSMAMDQAGVGHFTCPSEPPTVASL